MNRSFSFEVLSAFYKKLEIIINQNRVLNMQKLHELSFVLFLVCYDFDECALCTFPGRVTKFNGGCVAFPKNVLYQI